VRIPSKRLRVGSGVSQRPTVAVLCVIKWTQRIEEGNSVTCTESAGDDPPRQQLSPTLNCGNWGVPVLPPVISFVPFCNILPLTRALQRVRRFSDYRPRKLLTL